MALRPGAAEADAAYYPSWLPGGTVAVADARYRLGMRLLGPLSPPGPLWRLRDERRTVVARFERPTDMRDRAVRLRTEAAARPEIWLVLMIAVWATLVEPPMVGSM